MPARPCKLSKAVQLTDPSGVVPPKQECANALADWHHAWATPQQLSWLTAEDWQESSKQQCSAVAPDVQLSLEGQPSTWDTILWRCNSIWTVYCSLRSNP